MCGENGFLLSAGKSLRESPPHVWGKLVKRVDFDIFSVNHPHMCGENHENKKQRKKLRESPPHVWGKPCKKPMMLKSLRITPTCVGKILQMVTSDER